MSKENLYWPVYKNLEREVIELSRQIHFDENQLNVYSFKIAELLLRAAVEIESIAKDLYEQNGGNMKPVDEDDKPINLYFDTDCLNTLEDKWLLSKKTIFVSATTFYFDKKENKILTPLKKANKRGSSGANWKKAYQAIKHNRSKEFKQGNIKNLIDAMAALYLLNIYYKNETYHIKNINDMESFDISLGSDIFSISKPHQQGYLPNGSERDTQTSDQFQEYVYMLIYPEMTYKNIARTYKECFRKQKDFILQSIEFQDFSKHEENTLKENDLFGIAQEIGGWYFREKIRSAPNKKEALINSPEYKQYRKNNETAYPEESINDENIDDICYIIGGYAYKIKLFPLERQYKNLSFNSGMDVVLNKNQDKYPKEWRE